MGYSIITAEGFASDYDESINYLASVLHSPRAAEKLDSAVERAKVHLAENPLMMHISYDPDLAAKDCREYPVRSYVIVYRIVGNEVQLLCLLHQRQLKVVHQ